MKIHPKLGSRFARAIYDERIRRGWTQKQMADFLGMAPSLIHYYEGEDRTPRLETVDMIAAKLGMRSGIEMLK